MDAQTTGWMVRIRTACVALFGSGDRRAHDPGARAAALELDLRERDSEIRRLRQEYERTVQQAQRDQAGAAAAGVDALACRLAPLLSQLATMQALADSGRAVRAKDVLTLFGKAEAGLGESGLERIGAVGDTCGFDTRLHQRMGGADVADGDAVIVRFVGYRLRGDILLKAMVTRQAAAAGEGQHSEQDAAENDRMQ
jgi:molecular chaperone GrpE (heat shock protein)